MRRRAVLKTYFNFHLDLRSLALFRISFCLFVIYDLIDRLRFFSEHYTNDGMIGPSLVRSWTFHLGPNWWVGFVFALHFIVTLLLLLGWNTRIVAVLSWLFLVSLHHRNPYIVYGADAWAALSLIWGMFLPLGEVWSLDSRGQNEPKDFEIRHPLAWIWIGQVSAVYLLTALLKSGPEWMAGTALYHSVACFQYEGFLGSYLIEWLSRWTDLNKVATWTVLVWEFAVSVLLLSRWRFWAVLSILFFHSGVALFLSVGLFPVISIIVALSLIPTETWRGQSRGVKTYQLNGPLVGFFSFLFVGSVLVGAGALHPGFRKWSDRYLFTAQRSIRIEQRWNMFAPSPPRTHGWYSARGTLSDGTSVELLGNESRPWSSEQPETVTDFDSIRWKMFCFVTFARGRRELRPVLTDFLKRRWSRETHRRTLLAVELLYFKADLVPYEEQPFEETLIYREDFRF